MARLVLVALTVLGLAAVAAAAATTQANFAQLREASQLHPDAAAAMAEAHRLVADADIFSSARRGGGGGVPRMFAAQQTAVCRTIGDTPLMAAVNASCPFVYADGIFAVMNIANNTDAALEATASMCSSACVGAMNGLLAAVPQCFAAGKLRLFNLLPRMCTMHDGQSCSIRLRQLPKTGCEGFRNNQSGCTSADRWCAYTAGTGMCHFVATAPRLQQVCTPCFDVYISVFVAIAAAQASGSTSANARSLAKQFEYTRQALLNQKLFWCGKVDDQWCQLTYSAVDERAFTTLGSDSMSLADIDRNLTNTCTVSGRRCLNKVVGAVLTTIDITAEYTAWKCMQERCSNSVFSNLQSCTARNRRCALAYAATVAVGAATGDMVDFVCARNAAGAICGSVMHKYLRQDCWSSLASACSATCASWLTNNMSVEAGCCIDKFHSVVTSVYSYDTIPAYLRSEFNATAVRANGRKAAWNHPLAVMNMRCNVSVPTFNASQVLYNARPCAQAEPVRKALALRGLRWSKVQGNATLRMSLEVTLRADVARTMGVAADAIVNGTLVNDTTQALTLSTAATRRQSASASASASNWTAGVKYEFAVVTASAAMATAAASSFDAAVNTGAIEVAATAAVLADDCADCLGSPTAAPGETPAPPPTGPNAFSSIAGSSSATAGAASAAVTAGSTTLLVGIVAAAAAAMLF